MPFNPTDRFVVTQNTPTFHHKCIGHNIDRWMLFRRRIANIEVSLNFTQLIELWQNHRAELDANRPENDHHQNTVPGRASVEKEVIYALHALIKARAIEINI